MPSTGWRRRLPEVVGNTEGDLVVETTIDAGLQRAAQLTLRQTLDAEGKDLDVSEGAVVVLDTSGGIKALIGGRSYRSSPFDRAVKALRPAWLGLQALRLSHRARKRLHAGLGRL